MGASYATLDQLKSHWPALPASREVEATQKLHEASVEVRALYPDIDSRLGTGSLDADVPTLVVCRMVKRAMDSAAEVGGYQGVESIQGTTGPYSQTLKFTNPDGAIYLSKADKNLLRTSRARSRTAWTIIPSGGPFR